MRNIIKFCAPALLLAAPLNAATAADEPALSLESDVMAVIATTDEAGNTSTALAEPSEFTPGTKLSFGINFENKGTKPATNVTGTNPLNASVRLAPDADPALIVSVDGGSAFGELSTLSVTTQAGATRPAGHADVTHVRWTIETIAPGQSGRIGFPVIIR